MERPTETFYFEGLGKERTFALRELQTRADANPLADGRKQFRVWLGNREAAYLSFDTGWEDQLNLYEVFVAEAMRGQGVGTEIISFAIDLCREMGKPRLTVRPTPLSKQSMADLVAWYMRRGFKSAPEGSQLLEIVLEETRCQ
jgi:GNAT superfamily N-acetyltransferase